MERTEEALRERVRETPLSERLTTCEKYIASMCAERRPPKMTIPLQHYDEDFYIYTTLADAQAAIAALQARVKELEDDRSAWKEIAQDWSAAAKLAEQPEKFYEGYSAAVMNAMQALLTKARADLARVTAELEAAQHDAEVYRKMHAVASMERNILSNERADLQAELERVRALVKALPKVEGAVVVSNGYVKDSTRCHALFGADEDAALYAAILQHRQGMEG